MAKGIAINGMLRGKLGGVVYSRVNGEQISRVKAEVVKNPKTTAQMAQRAIFATATQAYSLMKPIVDHSREGVKYGAKTQQMFMKDALALLRTRAAADDGNFLIPNVAALMANPYVISKGSLSSPKNIAYSSTTEQVIITNMVNPTVDGNLVVTAKSFCDALGINKGDQITLVAIVRDDDQPVIGTYAGREYRRNKFIYARITVKANATDDEIVYNSTGDAFGTAAIVEGFDNNSFFTDGCEGDMQMFSIRGKLLAFACIRSQKVGNTWLRSYETLTLAEDQLIYNFNDIITAWTEGSTKLEFDSSRYLNNAEVIKPITTTYSLFKTSYIAETPAGEQDMVVNCAMVLKKTGNSMSYAPITDENRHVYTVKDNGHLLLNENISTSGIEYSVAQASKLIGETLIIDQEWRGKTVANSENFDLADATANVKYFADKVYGEGTEGTLSMPQLLMAIDGNGEARVVVEDGKALRNVNGQEAEISLNGQDAVELTESLLTSLQTYQCLFTNAQGTYPISNRTIDLATYNAIQATIGNVSYDW